MSATVVLSAVSVLSGLVVADATCLAIIHIVLLAHGQILCHRACVARLGSLPGFWLHVTGSVHSDDLLPFVELKAGAIKFENFHDGVSLQHAIFQVTVLLTIKVLLTLSRHFVQHVLRKVSQVRLNITWACINNIVDKEGQKFLFA